MTTKLLREARKLLEASGLPYEICDATRHVEFFIAGKKAFTLSHGAMGRDLKKLHSAINEARRAQA